MIYKKIFFFLSITFVLLSNSISAQNGKGKARFYTKMSWSIIKVDGLNVKYGEWIELDTGKHVVTASADGHIDAKEDFILKEGDLRTIPVQMEPTEEFKAHTALLKNRKRKRFILKSGPIVLYSLYGGYTLFNLYELNKDAGNNRKDAEEARELHSISFWKDDIDKYSKEFEDSREAYTQNIKDIRTQWTIFAGATVVAATVTYFTRKAADKINLPTFSEKSKLTNVSVSPILSPTQSGIYLNYTF